MIYRYAVYYPAIIAAIVLCTTASASIKGTVSDTTGSPVSGALVTFTDESNPDHEYYGYTDDDGTYEADLSPLNVNEETPSGFQLHQNYPNPFNPSTTISFSLDKAGFVNLSVYAITGQIVRTLIDNYHSVGSHTITWNGIGYDGKRLAAGIYIYRIKCGEFVESRKMLLIDGGSRGSISGSNQIVTGANIMSKSVREAETPTYHIRITGKDIAVYEESDVIAHEGDSQDFVVKRLSGSLMFVTLPGGTFLMGDDDSASSMEKPAHTVTLSGFEMSRTEITNSQFVSYLNEILALDDIFVNPYGRVYRKTDDWSGEIYLYTEFRSNIVESGYAIDSRSGTFTISLGKENWPVVAVTWHGAKAFALFYGFDLPTEEEWEYAARGGKQYEYATDDGTLHKTKALFHVTRPGQTVDVGSFPPNPFGLYEMSGNVEEWCDNWLYVDYSTNISLPLRIVRGGHFLSDYYKCRTADRWNSADPESATRVLGFRVVRRP